ncbi:MAG: hypothetical protein WA814_01930 [Candidatus Baltobacteraceae bacterium]
MKHAILAALGVVALVFAFASAPVASTAADPAPTPVPMPRPDFSPMMFLTGTWTCTQPLRGSTRPDTSTTTVAMDGAWMVTSDVAPPFDQYRTYTIKGSSYMTWDPTIKQWVQVGVDSSGGYGIGTSPGWTANTITWMSKGLDGSTGTDVITKVSDTETNDASSGTDAQGNTTKVTIHCTKTAS